jgi:hypothetical protein
MSEPRAGRTMGPSTSHVGGSARGGTGDRKLVFLLDRRVNTEIMLVSLGSDMQCPNLKAQHHESVDTWFMRKSQSLEIWCSGEGMTGSIDVS